MTEFKVDGVESLLGIPVYISEAVPKGKVLLVNGAFYMNEDSCALLVAQRTIEMTVPGTQTKENDMYVWDWEKIGMWVGILAFCLAVWALVIWALLQII